MHEPIYNLSNCRPAYQPRWSLALFAEQPIPTPDSWREQFRASVERDGVRLLEYRPHGNTHLFIVSTRPDCAPPRIVKSVKGRLQHAIRNQSSKEFRRNFQLISIGGANRETVETYVARQLGHHHMADPRVDQMLADFQFEFGVDLSQPTHSAHGEYLYNLHLVLVYADRSNEIRCDRLQTTADMIVRCASAKRHLLSKLSLLADHLHMTIRVPYDVAPGDVAIGYMNNIAFAHGMTRLFSFGYYVGTFGEYDMNVVRD